MSTIFISYRRGDSAGHTGRLFDALQNRFGRDSVFRDIEDLEPGIDFVHALDKALLKCDILIVVIGSQWASVADSKGRRLDQSDDFVRIEVAKALQRDVRVIPVLVDGATMPDAEELPEDVRPLARRNAIELSDTRWDFDVGRLSATLAKVLGVPEHAEPVRDATSKPGSSRTVATALIGVAAIGIAGLAIWYMMNNSGTNVETNPLPPTDTIEINNNDRDSLPAEAAVPSTVGSFDGCYFVKCPSGMKISGQPVVTCSAPHLPAGQKVLQDGRFYAHCGNNALCAKNIVGQCE